MSTNDILGELGQLWKYSNFFFLLLFNWVNVDIVWIYLLFCWWVIWIWHWRYWFNHTDSTVYIRTCIWMFALSRFPSRSTSVKIGRCIQLLWIVLREGPRFGWRMMMVMMMMYMAMSLQSLLPHATVKWRIIIRSFSVCLFMWRQAWLGLIFAATAIVWPMIHGGRRVSARGAAGGLTHWALPDPRTVLL